MTVPTILKPESQEPKEFAEFVEMPLKPKHSKNKLTPKALELRAIRQAWKNLSADGLKILFDNGETYESLAERFHVTTANVSQRAHTCGTYPKPTNTDLALRTSSGSERGANREFACYFS